MSLIWATVSDRFFEMYLTTHLSHPQNSKTLAVNHKGKPVTKNFYLSAMDYFIKLFPNDELIFIVAAGIIFSYPSIFAYDDCPLNSSQLNYAASIVFDN